MAKRVEVARAYVKFEAEHKDLDDVLAGIRNRMQQFGAELQAMGLKIMAVGAAMQAPLALATKQFASLGDAAAKAAQRTGMVSDEFSQLAHVAGLSGTNGEALEKGLLGMQRNVRQLSLGSKQAQEAFGQLGVTAKDLQGMSVARQFELLADRVSGFGDESQRAAVVMSIFGRGSAALIPMLSLGADGIRHYREEAERLGVSIGPEMAEKASRLQDMIERLKTAVTGVSLTVGSILAEGATKTLVYLTNLIANIREFLQNNPQVVTALQQIAIGLMAVGAALIGIGVASKLLSVLVSPGGILLALAGVVLYLTGALDPLIKKWGEAVMGFQIGGNSIRQWLGLIGESFTAIWEGILGAMQSLGSMLEPVFNLIKSFLDLIWQEIKLGFVALKVWIIEQINQLLLAIYKSLSKVANDPSNNRLVRWMASKGGGWVDDLHTGINANMSRDRVYIGEQRENVLGAKAEAGGAYTQAGTALGLAFGGAAARLKETFSSIGGRWGDALAPLMETIFGQKGASGGVKSLGDIFQGLGRQFGDWQGRAPGFATAGPALQAAMATTGTFSGLGAQQMGSNEAPLIKLGKEQLAVLKQIRDRTGGTAFEPTDW